MNNFFNNLLRSLATRATTVQSARQQEFFFGHMAIMIIFAFVGSVFLYTALSTSMNASLVVLMFATAFLGALSVYASTVMAEFCGQHARDLGAQKICQRVFNNQAAPPYALLLRSFNPDDVVYALAQANEHSQPSAEGEDMYVGPPAPLTLERALQSACDPTVGPLVTLGAPTPLDGAGRVPVPAADWQRCAALLIHQARTIFLVPGAIRASREIAEALFASDLMAHTVLIAPPIQDQIGPGRSREEVLRDWRICREQFERFGYEIPELPEHGALINVSAAGETPRILKLRGMDRLRLKEFLKEAHSRKRLQSSTQTAHNVVPFQSKAAA